jgi:hypothetical protein
VGRYERWASCYPGAQPALSEVGGVNVAQSSEDDTVDPEANPLTLSIAHTYTLKNFVYRRGIAQAFHAHDEQLEDDVIIETVPVGAAHCRLQPGGGFILYRSFFTRIDVSS